MFKQFKFIVKQNLNLSKYVKLYFYFFQFQIFLLGYTILKDHRMRILLMEFFNQDK
jgi:hypothetical protein